MKSIISVFAASLVAVCLTVNVQAKSLTPLKVSTIAMSDTGKMSKMEKKKMSKMSKKMDKKKMAKDTASKM